MPELRDPAHWWDTGYGRGMRGEPVTDVINDMRELVGLDGLEDWQLKALVTGHAFGCADLVAYVSDMAGLADRGG